MAGSNSGRVIPREELSEFQRWQFSTLLEEVAYQQAVAHPDSPKDATSQDLAPLSPELQLNAVNAKHEGEQVAPAVEEPLATPEEERIPFPTAQEIEAIERQAQEEGYQSGLAAGRLAAESEVNRLRALLDGVADVCRDAQKKLAEDMLDLALLVAQQFIRDELKADKTRLLPAIREAVAALPMVKEPSRLILNPEDLTALSVLLSGELPTDFWRFIPDPSMAAGSCRIETPSTSVDLSLESRWKNTLRVLGREKNADLKWRGDEDAGELPPHA